MNDTIQSNELKDGSTLIVQLDHDSREVQAWLRGYTIEPER